MKPSDCFRTFAAFVICGVLFSASAQPQLLSDEALRQISALHAEKEGRTPAQQKMDSQLVYATKQNRGQTIALNVPLLRPDVKLNPDGRVLVDLKANVTEPLLRELLKAGGEVVNQHPQFQAVRALVPLAAIESLAALPDVLFIRPADECAPRTGSLTSEGDTTHAAVTARTNFGVTGAGIKVGVLSDSVDYLTNSQASGDLGVVTVLPGQAGSSVGEGTALLEIIHDLAPGATLYFATAFSGAANFANNILALRAAGCDILVDDVGYFNESPFQDGIIAQAVNTVTTGGALYFASAGNSGNLNHGTSGTWEGDFLDGGAAGSLLTGKGGILHNFGGGTYNTVVAVDSTYPRLDLFWSDPLGASTNDYDLYVLNSTGTSVLRSSTTTQNGSQDPYESVGALNVGERVVIVKASGTNRFLHLETGRGRLTFNTSGNAHGHECATNAYCVAATSALTAYPGAFTGGVANPAESFTSDGPRRVFYQADGSAITPGNYSSTGGAVRQKPDITAADGVKTSVPGFNPFYGTSAASPHAAAIAALLKSKNNTLTPAQIRTALTNTALDIESLGYDRTAGAGIIMAQAALQFVSALPALAVVSTALTAEGCAPTNGVMDPGEVVTVNFALTNGGGSTANLVATLLETNGVTAPSAPQAYGDLGAAGGVVVRPFTFTANGACGGICTAVLQLQDGSTILGTVSNSFRLGALASASYSSGGVALAIPDNNPNAVFVPISVPDGGTVADVNVRVRLNHTYDSDLVLSLLHPDGTAITLASKRGAAGDNYGSGATNCSGTFTVFDDAASTPITSGTAPFAGSYKPTQGLTNLNGKPLFGTWMLKVTDAGGGDTGTVYCVQLDIARQQYLCCSPNLGPDLTGVENAALNYAEDQSATPISGTLALTDDGNLTNATVRITAGFVGGEDVLALNPNPQNGISALYSSNVLTLSGAATAANYQDALRSVTYANTSENPSPATRTVTFAVRDDAGQPSGDKSRDISVAAVNDPPSFVPGPDQNLLACAGALAVVGWATGINSGPPEESSQAVDFIVTNNNRGLFAVEPAVSPTGTLTFTPAANSNGVALVSVKLHDNGGTDSGGLDTSAEQIFAITILAPEPPTITCPTNVVVSTDAGQCLATNVSLGLPLATNHNCGELTVTNDAPPQFPPGPTIVTWTAVDASGNFTTCQQTVTVIDNEAPTLTCPADIVTTNSLGQCSVAVSLGLPLATNENCGVLVVTNNSPEAFPVGTNWVTWTAVDTTGNTTTCLQTVIVWDIAPLVLTGATNKTVEFGASWDFDEPSAVDGHCGSNLPPTIQSTVTNDIPCQTTITRTWQFTDCCTNSVTCSQTVTIADTVPPVLTCVSNKTVECGAAWSFDEPVSLDGCSGTNLTLAILNTLTNGDACQTILTRTWEATDLRTNTAVCSQTVTIADTIPPVLTCVSNKTVECGAAWSFDEPAALDGCSGTNLALAILNTLTNGDACQAILTRTWQATDPCTNSAICSQTVTLRDTTPPVLAVNLAGGLVTLTWVTVPDRTDWLEYKDQLDATNWIVLTNVVGSGSPQSIADGPISANARRFYRVRAQ